MNIIPMPHMAKQLAGTIAFGQSTVISGDFLTVIARARQELTIPSDKSTLTFVKAEGMAAEGYSIACSGGAITVKSSTESGAYYALMTLLQLAGGKAEIPAVAIEDAPKYKYRGFMLDVARHFFDVATVKRYIDNMSRLKLNYFHWHLSEDQGWRVEIKKYPELTSIGAERRSTPLSLTGYDADAAKTRVPRDDKAYGKGCYYTQAELKEVVAYAKERHIQVFPEIDMPGHLVSAIACYPHLSCKGDKVAVSDNWGVMDKIGCCGKEDIYTFAKDIIDELVEVFDCEFFHIGGDEVPKTEWKKCPVCQAKMKELGLSNEHQLQAHFSNVICDYLRTKGKRMIGWNEVLEGNNLNKDVVAQWWVGANGARELNWLKTGGNVILSKVDYFYMDHPYSVRPLSKTYSFCPKLLGVTDATNVLGIEAPQWTEYVRDLDKLDFNTGARLITLAEVAWLDESRKNYNDFEARLEGMRPYFRTLGMRIAPQSLYRGGGIRFNINRANRGSQKWRNEPNFELRIAKEQGWK